MAVLAVPIHVRYHSGCDWVLMNVADHRQEILLGIDQNRFVTATKQRSIPIVDSVKLLGVDPIEMAHRTRQTHRRGRQQEMIVVIQ
jgi:hypothetical protein